jgi:hypothetical protein
MNGIDTNAPGFTLPEAGLLSRAPFVDWILDGLEVWMRGWLRQILGLSK